MHVRIDPSLLEETAIGRAFRRCSLKQYFPFVEILVLNTIIILLDEGIGCYTCCAVTELCFIFRLIDCFDRLFPFKLSSEAFAMTLVPDVLR